MEEAAALQSLSYSLPLRLRDDVKQQQIKATYLILEAQVACACKT